MKSINENLKIKFKKKQIEMIDIRFVKQAGWKEIKIKDVYIFYTGSKKVIDNLMKNFMLQKF